MIPKVYTTFLLLEDGQSYQGWSFFCSPCTVGEVVFNTGMTGYQEVITDPSYYDQIILFTYPEIGNTGINIFDVESNKLFIKGLIAKNLCLYCNNWRNQMSLMSYLYTYKIPHIFGIDTRHLAKYLRNKGVMLGSICSNKLNLLSINLEIQKFKPIQSLDIINNITTSKSYQWLFKPFQDLRYYTTVTKFNSQIKLNIVVIDYGTKFNILNCLAFHGCSIMVVPGDISYQSIIRERPDGIVLSNGPGDPSLMQNSIEQVNQLLNFNIPIFGICLGHQLLSLALGAQTHKLKFGHRGLNHPAGSKSVFSMTSQNHGYVVSFDTLPKNIVNILDFNLNDKTLSGIVHRTKPYFSVQYHPEASPGPHDSDYLFTNFIKMMLLCK